MLYGFVMLEDRVVVSLEGKILNESEFSTFSVFLFEVILG